MTRHQNLDLAQPLRWAKTGEEDLFFEPLEQINTVEGVDTGYKTIYRKNPEVEIISTMSEDYSLIPNSMLHEIISDYPAMDLGLNLRQSSNCKNKSFLLTYDITRDGQGIDLGEDETDGDLFPNLIVKNSYNGSTCIEFEFGIFRSICSNGLVIPVEGMTKKFKKKHKGINGDLPQMIHAFLDTALSSKVFDKVRENISRNKASRRVKEISYTWLKSLPFNQLIPILAMISKYSEVSVITYNGTDSYNLTSTENARNFAEHITALRERDGKKKDIEKMWNAAAGIEYNEPVTNHWLLYNLMIKVLQAVVSQHRRLKAASEFSERFLGTPRDFPWRENR